MKADFIQKLLDFRVPARVGHSIHPAICTEAAGEIAGLQVALHDAINRPKGVVPDSALEFYDPHKFYGSPSDTDRKADD